MKKSDERTVQVPRQMIFGMMFGPLLPGFMVVMNAFDNPRFHGLRVLDILRLTTIGFGVGICFAGLMLFLHSTGKVSTR